MVSVCIPTYNGEKYIQEQIESILSEIDKNDKIIISDDGSTDNTLKVIKAFKDSRIQIYINESTRGHISNLQNALKHVNSDYIFLADQDDIWIKGKVKICLKYLEKYDLVIHDCDIVNSKGYIIKESYFELRNAQKGFLRNIYKNAYLGCCIAFKYEMIKYILPFPNKTIAHDMWIGLLTEIVGKTYFIDRKLLHYRRHGSNVSIASEESNFSLWFRLKYRTIIFANLFLRVLKFI